MSDVGDRLQAVFAEILDEVDTNSSFANRIQRALSPENTRAHGRLPSADQPQSGETGEARRVRRDGTKRPARRRPGAIEPFAIYRQGEDHLRTALHDLDLEQLKDIVAEHGMDTKKLAMKWKVRERLEELIVTTVALRSRKGDAFRGQVSTERNPG